MNPGPENFSEFADDMMRDLHDALLQSGASGMRGALYRWLPYYAQWHAEKTAERKKNTP